MKNHLAKVQQALLAGRHGVNGLEGYHQTNCTTSIPNKGLFRIYRDPNILYNTTSTSTSTKTYSYTGNVQSVSLTAGTHVIECWGANGGTCTGSSGTAGYGGYSKGTYTLTSSKTVYIYVGGKGGNAVSSAAPGSGGWNGGGAGGFSGSYGCGGGGGGTDVRTSQNTTYSNRIIVAGGGGAGTTNGYAGGNGGELLGLNLVQLDLEVLSLVEEQ